MDGTGLNPRLFLGRGVPPVASDTIEAASGFSADACPIVVAIQRSGPRSG